MTVKVSNVMLIVINNVIANLFLTTLNVKNKTQRIRPLQIQ